MQPLMPNSQSVLVRRPQLKVAVGTVVVGSIVLALIDLLLNPGIGVLLVFILGFFVGSLNYVAWRIITRQSDLILWTMVLLMGLGGTLLTVTSCSVLHMFGIAIPLQSTERICSGNTAYLALVYNFSVLWFGPLVYWLYVRIHYFKARQQ